MQVAQLQQTHMNIMLMNSASRYMRNSTMNKYSAITEIFQVIAKIYFIIIY